MITWTVRYGDGTTLSQLGPDGETVGTYGDIDRDRLEAFVLHWPDGRLVAVVDFTDDRHGNPHLGAKRLIWRKRHQARAGGGHVVLHLAGWQRKVAGHNVQSILYVNDETGVVVMSGQWADHAPMMGAVKPLNCETDLAE